MTDKPDTAPSDDKDGGDIRTRDRSPPFPFIALEKAVERARALEAEYKRSSGRVSNVLPLWGYTVKSSGGLQTVAALKAFGLIEDEGSGQDRKIKLTDLALHILKDERPGKREEALRKAAIKPKAIAELWEEWGQDRPPDAECTSELTLVKGYTEDAAARALRVYDDTLAYAKIGKADKNSDSDGDRNDDPVFKVGDYIQWSPDGVLQFPEPQRISGLSESGDFVFVEGSLTGIPTNEVTKVQATVTAEGNTNQRHLPPKPQVAGVRQDIWNLDEGPVVLQYPSKLSAESFEDLESWLQLQLRKIKRGTEQ